MNPTSVAGDSDAARFERDAWAVLAAVRGLGPVGFGRLLRRHGSASAVLELARSGRGVAALVAAGLAADAPAESGTGPSPGRLDPNVATAIGAAARDAAQFTQRIADLKLVVMTLEDDDYPARLRALDVPPPVLFVRGDRAHVAAHRPIGVVGTRRATEAGRRLAAEIGMAISVAGGVVVSGLALGIDGAAHSGAVRVGLPTVAVLGSGHAHLYPRAHGPLAHGIVAAGGAIVSELPPDTAGNRGTFPRRNRIISGLVEAIVVIEAPRGSGALITADWALEQGRDCFLVPGPLGARASEGCLAYLRAYPGQARIVTGVPELLEDLSLPADVHAAGSPSAMGLGETEAGVAALVMSGHSTVDSLAAASGLAVSTVLATLTLLEMRGLVAAAFGRYRPRGTLLPTVIAGSSQAQSGSPWQQRDQSPIDSRAASPAGRS